MDARTDKEPSVHDGPPPFSLSRVVAFGLASGILGTIPLGRIPRPARTAMVLVPALVTAGLGFTALRSGSLGELTTSDQADGQADPSSSRGTALPPLSSAAIAAAAGVVMAGGMVLSIAVDTAVDSALVRRGVRRPRAVIGIGSGVLMAGMEILDSDLLRR